MVELSPMVPAVSTKENTAMLTKKKRKIQKWNALRNAAIEGVWVSSKADAFLDGMGSLLEVFPGPQHRTIRAFLCHHSPRASSVAEAIRGDWAVVGQDMWTAIKAHEHEESTQESHEEAAAGFEPINSR